MRPALALFRYVDYVETRYWRRNRYCIGEAAMSTLGLVMLLVMAAYWLGMRDGLTSRPPVLRGTYDSGEHDDRVTD